MKLRTSGPQPIFIWITIGLTALGIAALFAMRANWPRRSPIETIRISGAVLRQDADPKKQSPIANAHISATGGLFDTESTSDSSGAFELNLRSGLRQREPITLRFEHAEYRPVEITKAADDRLYVVRMDPIVDDMPPAPPVAHQPAPPGSSATISTPALAAPIAVQIKDVRVRYTVKNQTTVNVGSLAKQFQSVNTGNVPCNSRPPCSPDGVWKAATTPLTLDAGEENQFRNVRVTCIAGPCPFTKINPGDLSHPSRIMSVSVLNWSDTAAFLVEAEVTRTVIAENTRRSYPTVIGQTMTFTLPAAAEGPTVEADLNGEEIVFPLGPRITLSWATCSVEIVPGQNKTYRCELKPGFQFLQ